MSKLHVDTCIVQLAVLISSYKGILAGIWPCGIIAVLSELYISESKSQVCGAIHSFMQKNEANLAELRKRKIFYCRFK